MPLDLLRGEVANAEGGGEGVAHRLQVRRQRLRLEKKSSAIHEEEVWFKMIGVTSNTTVTTNPKLCDFCESCPKPEIVEGANTIWQSIEAI